MAATAVTATVGESVPVRMPSFAYRSALPRGGVDASLDLARVLAAEAPTNEAVRKLLVDMQRHVKKTPLCDVVVKMIDQPEQAKPRSS